MEAVKPSRSQEEANKFKEERAKEEAKEQNKVHIEEEISPVYIAPL